MFQGDVVQPGTFGRLTCSGIVTSHVELPPLTYLSFDSLSEGVGASQVLLYVEALARRGLQVRLHTFEKVPPSETLESRLRAQGVNWFVHQFGAFGPAGGLRRVAVGAAAVRGAELVHARSALPAACALLGRPGSWIWDMRGFWSDERIELGGMQRGATVERVVRLIEHRAALSAEVIITLAAAAIPVIAERYGEAVARKARVIPTCVDLERFALSELLPPPVRLLISGTLNARYDVDGMLRFAAQLARQLPVTLYVLCPDPSRFESRLRSAGAVVDKAEPSEMPTRVASAHVGLSLLKPAPTPASKASVPTKLGEFLACGRPIVVSKDLGDMEELLARYDCGVVVRDSTDDELERCAAELARLLQDPSTAKRCRALAEDNFSLDHGVSSLIQAYKSACSQTGPGQQSVPT